MKMFRYTAKYFVDDHSAVWYEDERVDEYGRVTESGIVAAGSYGEAADIIVDYCVGEDVDNMCSIVELYECENPMTDAHLEEFLKRK